MKIVQTNKAYFPLIGGVETIVSNLAEGLSSSPGIEVEILVCNNISSFTTKRDVVNGVDVTYVPMWVKIASLPISPTYPFRLLAMKGDILHIHEPFPLADLSVLLLFPFIRKNFSRIVVSWHSDIVRQKWALWMYSFLLHRFLQKVDVIIVATPNHITSSRFLPAYMQKCEVVPYGVNMAWADNYSQRGGAVESIRRTYGSPLLLFVGRLVYYKGVDYLIDAMVDVPEAHLLIVGTGPLYEELLGKIVSQKLEGRITILRDVSNADLYAYYDACDIFILPSTEPSEAFGLVQVEAMACRKPVISTNLGTGVSYVNQHGITGLTVQPRDAKALADAIGTLIREPKVREQLGKNGRERAVKEYSVGTMIQNVLAIYKRILQRDGDRS